MKGDARPHAPCLLLAFVAVAASAGAARAERWTGNTAVNDDWGTPSNWSTGSVPTDGDNLYIDASNSAGQPVVYDSGATVSLIASTLGDAATDGGFLRIDAGQVRFSSGPTVIGKDGTAGITVNAGGILTKNNGNLDLGVGAGSSGTITVSGGGKFQLFALNTVPRIGIAGTGALNVHGGAVSISNTTARTLNVGLDTGTGLIDLRGGTISASLSTASQTLKNGYLPAGGTGRAMVQGYGTLDMRSSGGTGVGTFQQGGFMVADGTETTAAVNDHTLSLIGQSIVGTRAGLEVNDNTSGTTHFGWYTRNKGALTLSSLPIGNAAYACWGGDQNNHNNVSRWTVGSPTPVAVNSAYLHRSSTSDSLTLQLSLLDPTRTQTASEASPLLANGTGKAFLNIWQVKSTGGTLAVDKFYVRYDESYSPANAANKHGRLLGFYYWDGVTGSWTDLTSQTTLDTTNYLANFNGSALSIANGGSGFFALAATALKPVGTMIQVQ